MTVEKIIDHSLYPRQALADARHAYKDYCTLKITPLDHGRAVVQIEIKPYYATNGRQIALEFLNYMLDRAVQLQLENG